MSSSRKEASGPYLIGIENLPRKYTWQDLKDLVRRQAKHSPAWTTVKVCSSQDLAGKGCVKIQRKNEAWSIFQWLCDSGVEGKHVTVHIFDITESRGAWLIDCNCGRNHRGPVQPQDIAHLGVDQKNWPTASAYTYAPPVKMAYPPIDSTQYVLPQMINGTPIATSNGTYQVVTSAQCPMQPVTQAALAQSMAAMSLQQRGPVAATEYDRMQAARAMAQQRLVPQQAILQQRMMQAQQQQQQYATSSNGTPVNTQNGYVKTERRGVFVSKISYKARSKDIEKLFSAVGKIVRCELQTDSRTGKSKGNATIQYSTAEEAERAIKTFNGKKWMEMKLEVRGDREATALPSSSTGLARSNVEPVIVNGSISSTNSD